MPFRNGTCSYARFRVVSSGANPAPRAIDESLIARLAEHTLAPTTLGEPEPAQFGFCGGRHVFDEEFSALGNAFGEMLLFGMRIDTNKVPAEIKRAYRAMAERVYTEDSSTGFLSRRERTAAKEDAEERCRQELAEGRYRRSKMVDVLWDVKRGIVLAPAFSDAVVNGLRDLFLAAFDVRLQPLSSGTLAYEVLSAQGRTRDYEDLRPGSFGVRPSVAVDAEYTHSDDGSGRPPLPWTHTATESSDFLGNEFLMWLWRLCDVDAGAVDTSSGEVLFAIDRSLDMQCAWDATGKQSLSASGPARLPEARCGLQHGKWPRKAGLILAAGGDQFEATFQADRFQLTGIKIPKPEEDMTSMRDMLEYRLSMLRTLDDAIQNAYKTFLEVRSSSRWASTREQLATWIANRRPTAPVTDRPVEDVEVKQPTIQTYETSASNGVSATNGVA